MEEKSTLYKEDIALLQKSKSKGDIILQENEKLNQIIKF